MARTPQTQTGATPLICPDCGAEIEIEAGTDIPALDAADLIDLCGCDVDANHADDGEDRYGNPLEDYDQVCKDRELDRSAQKES